MCESEKKLYCCLEQCRTLTDFEPDIAVVLGSGLGSFADDIDVECIVDYGSINGLPVSTAPTHKGRYIFGRIAGAKIVVMQGRVHYYEGYPMNDVVLPVRLAKLLGAKTLILTNAGGAINTDFNAGDFMMIEDHISSFIPSPLIGENFDTLGVRFPDMSNIYDKELRDVMQKSADELGISLKRGVFVQTSGPNYESPAEIRMFSKLGADAVGMSTVCEAMAANHAGMKICALSCITNMACGITADPLSQQEVEKTAAGVEILFRSFLAQIIKNISKP